MLGQVLGPGRALVRVTADINLRSQTEKVETYNLEQRPVKKEEITNEKSNTGGSKGFAGVASNTGAKPATGGNETNRQMETQRTEYFDPPRSEVTRVEAAGSVERQTIAAMVDLSPQGDNPAPNVGIKDVEEIIKQAVGYKAGRDEIKVSEAKIPVAADLGKLDPEVLDMQRWQAYGNIARNASLGVGAMVAMLLGWLTLRRLQKSEAGTGNNLRLQVAQDHERRVIAFRVAAEQNPELLANVLTRWLERDQMPTQSATAAQTERLAA
jgi:flagellar M-ring protein FliF